MEVIIKKSKRKTMSLWVDRQCNAIVRCPYGTTKEAINTFIENNKQWLEKQYILQKTRINSPMNRQIDPEQEKYLRERAKEIIPDRVKHYSEIMGVKANRITITSAQTRFGSCSSKNNLSFSFRLMLYPQSVIDYVVVHELAHIKEKNHSKSFYSVVSSVLPDYKKIEKMMKEYIE